MTALSRIWAANEERRNQREKEREAPMAIVVTTVTLGRWSMGGTGRLSQYRATWRGLKRQNKSRHRGFGSQTETSHTSLPASGWARDSADSLLKRPWK